MFTIEGEDLVEVKRKEPKVWWTFVSTAVFPPLGALVAHLSNKEAKRQGVRHIDRDYWVAFGLTAFLWCLIAVITVLTIGVDHYQKTHPEPLEVKSHYTPQIVAGYMIESDWQNGNDKIDATAAACTPVNVDGNGVGQYDCVITFNHDSKWTGKYHVQMPASGVWESTGY